jgi:hypothetical protein
MKFEVRYLRRAAKFISGGPAPSTALFYNFEAYYWHIKNVTANTCYSESY